MEDFGEILDLDDVSLVSSFDSMDLIEEEADWPARCLDAIKVGDKVDLPRSYEDPSRIVVCGMGGSAIGGDYLKFWLLTELKVPIIVSRDYVLPAFVGEEDLVICVSASGNTEETLSAFYEGMKRGCRVLVITSNGFLETFCGELGVPLVLIPKPKQPRFALPYLFFPMPVVLEKVGLLSSDWRKEAEEVAEILKKNRDHLIVKAPLEENLAKKIAMEAYGRIPLVYGFRHYSPVANRIKCEFNENSKVLAVNDVFPEINHNTIVGFEAKDALTKIFTTILLRDYDEPLEIKTRIETTKRVAIEEKTGSLIEVFGEGKSLLTRMFSATFVGDFASIYLAILYEKDPATIITIDKLKKELKEKVGTQEKIKEAVNKLKR